MAFGSLLLFLSDANLSNMYRRLTHGRADAGKLGLCLGNGLPQLCPAAIGQVDLPPVDLETLLLELQQHPVPRRVGLPYLIPNHLKQQKTQPQFIAPCARGTAKATTKQEGEKNRWN